jgi:kinesin family protein 5
LKSGVVSTTGTEVWVADPSRGIREFAFDEVFGPAASQQGVHAATAERAVADVVNGANACIFCYGQTGSGKTHTMFGAAPDDAAAVAQPLAQSGLVPRACAQLLRALVSREEHAGIRWRLGVSYVQVFGDEVTDLLGDAQAGPIGWQGNAASLVLGGHGQVELCSTNAGPQQLQGLAAELERLLRRGEAQKRQAATAMNERSSRAHSLLYLRLLQQRPAGRAGGVAEVESALCLADLGGSEQVKKSRVSGARLSEAININRGLLSLKNCISALHAGHTHVPYMDNRLTELLKAALGGNSKTTLVVTASLEPAHAAETTHALRFGERCSAVKNDVTKRAVGGGAARLLAALDRQIERAQAEIQATERWETVFEEFDAEVANPFTGEVAVERQRKAVSRPAGAEQPRQALERLLAQRRGLVGE